MRSNVEFKFSVVFKVSNLLRLLIVFVLAIPDASKTVLISNFIHPAYSQQHWKGSSVIVMHEGSNLGHD